MRLGLHLIAVLAFVATGTTPVPATRGAPQATIVLSGGCYWTMETVFERVRGVSDVVSGVAGRTAGAASYSRNPTNSLGLAEAVRVTFDTTKVSLAELLRVYFTVAHDPAQIDRQGPDVGRRYRSVVWTSSEAQHREVTAFVEQVERQRGGKVATQLATLDRFEPVPESEQDFATKYPDHPYVVAWDRPKLERFKREIPDLYRERK